MGYATRRNEANLRQSRRSRGVRVAVPRHDRAGAEEPPSLELLVVLRREPALDEPVAEHHRERDVAVPDEDDGCGGQEEVAVAALVGEDVLPDRAARARVEELGVLRRRARRKRRQEGARLLVEGVGASSAASAASGLKSSIPSVPSATRSWLPTRHRSLALHQPTALVRPRAVADEVTQAPQRIGLLAVDLAEHRLEGVQICVNVGDDGDASGSEP